MPVVLDELLALAQYYGVRWQEDEEYWLLSIVKEAILAPVLHPWCDSEDEAGHPIFVHTGTGLASPQHPLDSRFMRLIQDSRLQGPPEDNKTACIMLVTDMHGQNMAFDFACSSIVTEDQPDGAVIAPVSTDVLPKYMPEVEAEWLKQAAAVSGTSAISPTVAMHQSLPPLEQGGSEAQPGDRPTAGRDSSGVPPKPRRGPPLPPKPFIAPAVPATGGLRAETPCHPPPYGRSTQEAKDCELASRVPPPGLQPVHINSTCLTFFSWWQEDWESNDLTLRVSSGSAGGGIGARHMAIRFNVQAATFDITIRESGRRDVCVPPVTLRGVAAVTTAAGMPVQPWDVHVGASLVVLGNRVQLRACDAPTGRWLSSTATHVLQLRDRALRELRKYSDQKLPAALTRTSGGGLGRLAQSYCSAVELQRQGGVNIQATAYQVERLCAILETYRPDQVQEIRERLRELHRQTRSSSFFGRCSLRSAPAATRGSACMSLADLTAAESKRASVAAVFPDGSLALVSDAVRKELDAQLQAALRAVTPGVQATSHTSGQKKARGTSPMVDFLRATCPGLVPASANQAKKRMSAARRPATVPKPCTLHPAKEDSGFYIPTRPVLGA